MTLFQNIIALLVWLVLLVVAFGIPFILSHALVFLLLKRSKNTGLLINLCPFISVVLFAFMSFAIFHITASLKHVVKPLIFPLPWTYHHASSAGALIMVAFLIAVSAVLAILNFYRLRVLCAKLFSGGYTVSSAQKSGLTISSHVVYGLSGAVLLFLLYGLLATTVPYWNLPHQFMVLLVISGILAVTLAVMVFIFMSPLAWVGYFTAAAAFLGIISVVFRVYRWRMFHQTLAGMAHVLIAEGAMFGWLLQIIPLAMICIAYIVRLRMSRRSGNLSRPVAFLVAALASILATAVLLSPDMLPPMVEPGNHFALNLLATAMLFLIVIAPMIFVLVLVLRPIQMQRTDKDITPAIYENQVSQNVTYVSPEKSRITLATMIAMVISVIVVFWFLRGTATGFMILLALFAMFYLAVSVVYHLSRFFSDIIASRIFSPQKN